MTLPMPAESELRAMSGDGLRGLLGAMPVAFIEADVSASLRTLDAALGRWAWRGNRSGMLEIPALMHSVLAAARIVDFNACAGTLFGLTARPVTLDALWPAESHGVFADLLLAWSAGARHVTRDATLGSITGERVVGTVTGQLAGDTLDAGRVMFGIVDTTELHRMRGRALHSEQRYRALFEHMPIGLCVLDGSGLDALYAEAGLSAGDDLDERLAAAPDLLRRIGEVVRIEEMNGEAARILGFEDAREAAGEAVGFAWSVRSDTFRRSVVSGIRGQALLEETQMTDRRGQAVDALLAFANVRSGGQRTGVLGMVDIRDRVRAQRDLDRLKAAVAKSAQRSRAEELSADISDRIGQPLSAIIAAGSAALRRHEPGGGDGISTRAAVARIVGYAMRAREVIAEIRAAQNRSANATETCNAREAVESALAIVQPDATLYAVAMHFAGGERDARVAMARTALETAVAELVRNALDALVDGPAGPHEVRIDMSVGDGRVEIGVEDSGPGFADADELGSGLRMCRHILESHGGSIEIGRSQALGGARVAMKLPSAE